jgi:hypothetical protein
MGLVALLYDRNEANIGNILSSTNLQTVLPSDIAGQQTLMQSIIICRGTEYFAG